MAADLVFLDNQTTLATLYESFTYDGTLWDNVLLQLDATRGYTTVINGALGPNVTFGKPQNLLQNAIFMFVLTAGQPNAPSWSGYMKMTPDPDYTNPVTIQIKDTNAGTLWFACEQP